MDSIQDFFPKGCDPERPIAMSETNVKWTFSMLMDILQHVFRDGIDVEKCPNCEPSDKKILDLSFGEAGRDANVKGDKCPNCGKPKIKSFKYVILEAPTGTGKSWIASTLALWKKNVTILTSQKGLQDQYESDFPFVKTVRGRDNYDCIQLLNQENALRGTAFRRKRRNLVNFGFQKKNLK